MLVPQSVRIDGEPPTFNYPMSERERDWRACVVAAVRNLHVGPQDGIRADFTTSSDKRGGHYFDLDNMAKCVFDALSGHKPKYVEVTRSVGPQAGVVLTVGLPEPRSPLFLCRMAVRRGSKRAPVPDSALSNLRAFTGTAPLYVHLAFHEDVSLTDFGLSGAIKPALDCLWPVLGGTPTRPHDYRIRRLVLKRSMAHPSGVSVYIGTDTGAVPPEDHPVPVIPESKRSKAPSPKPPESPVRNPRWDAIRRLANSPNLSERKDALNRARVELIHFLQQHGFPSNGGQAQKALQQYAKAGHLNAQQLVIGLEALDLRNRMHYHDYEASVKDVTKAVECLLAIVT
jgi:hypothetical protein